MSSMTLEEVEKALYQKMGAPMVIYNERQDTYILKRLFFRAPRKIRAETLAEKIKGVLPAAKVYKVWNSREKAGSQCGFECVEFAI